MFYLACSVRWDDSLVIPLANMLAAVAASLAVNWIVFRLSGVLLPVKLLHALAEAHNRGITVTKDGDDLEPLIGVILQNVNQELFHFER